jgi:hypothetical protein
MEHSNLEKSNIQIQFFLFFGGGAFCQFGNRHWFQCRSVSNFLSQCGSGSREPNHCGSGAGLGSWSDLKTQKVEFYMKNIPKVCNRSQEHSYEGKKAFLKAGNQVYFCKFGQFPCSRIRIQDSKRLDPQSEGDFLQNCKNKITLCLRMVGILY